MRGYGNSNSDWSDQFFKQISSLRFHRCIVLELLKLKNIGIQKSAGKVRKKTLKSRDFSKTETLRAWPSGGGLPGSLGYLSMT